MINSLTAKARTACLSVYEGEEGTRIVSEEHKTGMKEGLLGSGWDSPVKVLAEAVTVLAAAALIGVDIDKLLADLFWEFEQDPASKPDDTVRRVLAAAIEAAE